MQPEVRLSVRAIRVLPEIGLVSVVDLEEIDVTDDNEHYRSEEGVLFTADDTLMYYPKQKGSEAYTVPEGTVKIGAYAFDSCYFAPKEVTLPDSVSVIEESAFKSCSELTTVKMGQGLEMIGERAFSYCGLLAQMNLPEGLLSIDEETFAQDPAIQKVMIAEGTRTIGPGAFSALALSEQMLLTGRYSFRIHLRSPPSWNLRMPVWKACW